MSALTWDQAIALQHRPLSDARLKAEMEWAVLTGRAPSILRTFDDVPEVRPPAPAPHSPRGRGKRKAQTRRVVTVEKKRVKLIACPDGRVLAARRTQRSFIQCRA